MNRVKNLFASLAFIFAIGAAFAFGKMADPQIAHYEDEFGDPQTGAITVPSGVDMDNPCVTTALSVPICKVGTFDAYQTNVFTPANLLKKP